MVSVNTITGTTMMTRKDDQSKAPIMGLALEGFPGTSSEDREPTQMLYHVEYLVPGTQLVHGFRTIYPVSELELGALITALELASRRTFGGMGSKGFGRIEWIYRLALRSSWDALPGAPLTLRLGETTGIPEELVAYRDRYKEYVSGLRQTIEADSNLSAVIRFVEAEHE
jgi:hypothetical protein